MDYQNSFIMGIDLDHAASDQAARSGEVITYFMSPEDMERLYGKPEPAKPRPKSHVGWPECGQPNLRHVARQSKAEDDENDLEDIDPGEEIDIDEIERIESGAVDPVLSFDGCKW